MADTVKIEIGTRVVDKNGNERGLVTDISKAGTLTIGEGWSALKCKPEAGTDGALWKLRGTDVLYDRFYVADSPAWQRWAADADRRAAARAVEAARSRVLSQTHQAINDALNKALTVEAVEAVTAAVLAALEVPRV